MCENVIKACNLNHLVSCPLTLLAGNAGVTGNADKERLISPDMTGDVTVLSAAAPIPRYDNELHATTALFRFVVGQ